MTIPYRSLNAQLQAIFGERVHKIPIDAGFCCPNKSGEISENGCVFCDPYGSGYIAHKGLSVTQQIADFKLHRKEKKFLGYFQANCNTNAPVDVIKSLFDSCLKQDGLCGLIVGTRPDCLPKDVLLLLEEYSRKTFLVVELGLQSIHEQSLIWLNRNHTYAQFEHAFFELKKRKIQVVIHLIVGIPGERIEENRASIVKMNELLPWGIKIHLLHVLRGTELYARYIKGGLQLMDREEYVETVIELLEWLHPKIGVHRLSADRDARLFVAPEWAQQKTTVLNEIHQRMLRQNRWQGKRAGFPETSYLEP